MRTFLGFLGFIAAVLPGPVMAAPMASDPSCDKDFWDVMGARAWMEGKHDMEAAQTLILRPDSVMDLAGLECRLIELQAAADNMFSDNKASSQLFKNQSFSPDDDFEPTIQSHGYSSPLGTTYSSIGFTHLNANRLDNALQNLIRTGITKYFSKWNSCGGAAGSPKCGSLVHLWQVTKCTNINENMFWTFKDISTTDPRVLPCACNSQRDEWKIAVAAANPKPADPAASGGIDAVATYLSRMAPGACGGPDPNKSPRPIPTGVMIRITGQKPYPDAVCLSPSCWYDPEGNGGEGSCEN